MPGGGAVVAQLGARGHPAGGWAFFVGSCVGGPWYTACSLGAMRRVALPPKACDPSLCHQFVMTYPMVDYIGEAARLDHHT